MPVEPLDYDEVAGSGNGACAHNRLDIIAAGVGSFFTNPPANTTQRVDVQLRNHLQNLSGRSLTANQVEKAVRLYLERRNG